LIELAKNDESARAQITHATNQKNIESEREKEETVSHLQRDI
jgi:hypothetical protein